METEHILDPCLDLPTQSPFNVEALNRVYSLSETAVGHRTVYKEIVEFMAT